ALAELRDLEGLSRVAPRVLAHRDDPQWLGGLALALRRQPLAGAALRDAGGSALLPLLRGVLALAITHRRDAPLRRELLDELRDVERHAPTNAAEREALHELLVSRSELWYASGDPQRERRDLHAARALAGP
ncbi:MAG: hypothetical protein KC501_37255, partial [Myxococcales bacterium]|nr:hypothetical protein [Myxococcales bacterium]